MDKRKLIGTIVGVIMFAALIVGATYAWLTFTANVTNSTANGTTLKYIVNYGKGNDISDMPILVNGTTSTAAEVTLTAQRPQGSIADNIKIYISTNASASDDVLSTSGAIKYVICETACNASFEGNTINSLTTESTVEIFSGTLEGTTTSSTNKTHTYKIYFWLDAATITNSHLNKSYSGYIHADSTQNTTNYG